MVVDLDSVERHLKVRVGDSQINIHELLRIVSLGEGHLLGIRDQLRKWSRIDRQRRLRQRLRAQARCCSKHRKKNGVGSSRASHFPFPLFPELHFRSLISLCNWPDLMRASSTSFLKAVASALRRNSS